MMMSPVMVMLPAREVLTGMRSRCSLSPQMLENQMEVRKKEIEELQSQAQALSQEGKSTDEVDSKRLTVQTKFRELLEPLNERKQYLLASREIHQFNRDVEDEIVSPCSHLPLPTFAAREAPTPPVGCWYP